MCDYSLAGIPNRLAAVGDQLTVHRFYTGSIGLATTASVEARDSWRKDPSRLKRCLCAIDAFLARVAGADSCAVCVPPGAALIIRDFPKRLQRELQVGPTEDVTFVQLSSNDHQYRDAVRFRNGREVLLQRLSVGQRVSVLSLDSLIPDSVRQPSQLVEAL